MRLDKYLADMSVGTRSEVRNIIKYGKVKVNDQVIRKADYQINDSDEVKLNDKLIEYIEYEYYIINKPQGYICATEDKHVPVIMELIDSKRKDLVPVGRLDKDTEGLLLITNDGQLNHELLSPKNHVGKKYYVELDKDIPENANEILSNPIVFEDFTSKPAKYEKIDSRKAYLTISEGKYHQVKRMFKKLGCTVIFLKRISLGSLSIDGLNTGEYRALTDEEIYNLRNEIE